MLVSSSEGTSTEYTSGKGPNPGCCPLPAPHGVGRYETALFCDFSFLVFLFVLWWNGSQRLRATVYFSGKLAKYKMHSKLLWNPVMTQSPIIVK